MSCVESWLILAACTLCPLALQAGSPPAPKKQADSSEISRLIRQLGSDEFTKREEASKALEKIGEPTLPTLRGVACTTEDAEIRRRAKKLLRSIEAGLYGTVRSFEGYRDGVQSLALSPDGRTAISGNRVEAIRLDLETGRMDRYQAKHLIPIWCAAFSSNGRWVLSGNMDNSLILWEVDTGKVIQHCKGHSGIVWSVAMSRDDKRALSGSEDGTVRLWDLKTAQEVARFAAHRRPIWFVAFLPNGTQGLSADRDGKVSLWDLESGKIVRELCLQEEGVNVKVALSPDGKMLISGHSRGDVRLWELRSGKELRHFAGHRDSVDCVTFHPDGSRALSASMDGTVRVWDVESGEELHCFTGHSNSVWRMDVSRDGRQLLSGGGGSEVCQRRLP